MKMLNVLILTLGIFVSSAHAAVFKECYDSGVERKPVDVDLVTVIEPPHDTDECPLTIKKMRGQGDDSIKFDIFRLDLKTNGVCIYGAGVSWGGALESGHTLSCQVPFKK